MKTNLTNILLISSMTLSMLACSKMETGDMMFKEAVSEASSATPSPGEVSDPTQDPSVVVVDEVPKTPDAVVIISNPDVVVPPPVADAPKVEPPPIADAPKVEPPPIADAPKVEPPPVADAPKVEPPPVLEAPKVEPPPVVVKTPEPEYTPYPESAIPVCKVDLVIRGLGAAGKVAIASASKADLKSASFAGFESLSASELKSMREVLDAKMSSASVQYVTSEAAFDKSQFKGTTKILVVVDGKEARSLDMGGLGKDAQIMVMIASEGHNTVCVQTDGNSSMESLSLTVQGDKKYVSRGDILVNGNGSINSYLKVVGGHQTGSKYSGKSVKDSKLTFITEGENDTFTSLVASGGILNSDFVIRIKGKDATGWGMTAQHMRQSSMNVEIDGYSNVKALMNINSKLEDNEYSGWIKEKTEVKAIADIVEGMPVS